MNKVAPKDRLNDPKLMQHVILLLLYADDVDNMQHLLGVLEEFCHSSGLVVNVN